MRLHFADNPPAAKAEKENGLLQQEGRPDFFQHTPEGLEVLQSLAQRLETTEAARELVTQSDSARLRLREVCSGGIVTVQVPPPPCMPQVFHLHAALERRLSEMSHGALDVRPSIGVRRGRAFGVTSAVRGEGKTTIALQLALHAAQSSCQNVCLMELGLTGDDLCVRLRIDAAGEGVVGVLEGSASILRRLRIENFEELVILPAGKAPASAARVARSPRVGELIAVVREMCDLLVVDLPAVDTHNALPLIDHLDGVVMVVRAGVTPQRAIRQALDQLDADKVLGMVLNRGTCSIPDWLKNKILGQ
jgi:Mrp family chromosome partitioning ATPase